MSLSKKTSMVPKNMKWKDGAYFVLHQLTEFVRAMGPLAEKLWYNEYSWPRKHRANRRRDAAYLRSVGEVGDDDESGEEEAAGDTSFGGWASMKERASGILAGSAASAADAAGAAERETGKKAFDRTRVRSAGVTRGSPKREEPASVEKKTERAAAMKRAVEQAEMFVRNGQTDVRRADTAVREASRQHALQESRVEAAESDVKVNAAANAVRKRQMAEASERLEELIQQVDVKMEEWTKQHGEAAARALETAQMEGSLFGEERNRVAAQMKMVAQLEESVEQADQDGRDCAVVLLSEQEQLERMRVTLDAANAVSEDRMRELEEYQEAFDGRTAELAAYIEEMGSEDGQAEPEGAMPMDSPRVSPVRAVGGHLGGHTTGARLGVHWAASVSSESDDEGDAYEGGRIVSLKELAVLVSCG